MSGKLMFIKSIDYNRLCPTSFQQRKNSDTIHLGDDGIYTSDGEKSIMGPAGPSPVGTGATEGDATEEVFDGAGIRGIETESEDEDPVATRRYWEVRRKKEGVHKV